MERVSAEKAGVTQEVESVDLLSQALVRGINRIRSGIDQRDRVEMSNGYEMFRSYYSRFIKDMDEIMNSEFAYPVITPEDD